MATQTKKITISFFINTLLNGMAAGIVVALIANAVLGQIFKALSPYSSVFGMLYQSVTDVQYLVSAVIGFIVGIQLGFVPIKASMIGLAGFIASGAIRHVDGIVKFVGIGDLINVMIIVALAALVTLWLGNKLGSLTIIVQPIIVAGGIGALGLFTLPYIAQVSAIIGKGINSFTVLQPILMCILIAASFSIVIISPISTVAIGIAVGLAGLASGAANLGVAACTAVLIIGSWRVNKAGITAAIALGGMKLMIPNLVRYPIMALPVVLTAAASGIAGRFLGIMGDKVSAGFGIAGLVGPIKAYEFLTGTPAARFIALIIAYFVVPFGCALLLHILFTKIIKLYKPEIYKSEAV